MLSTLSVMTYDALPDIEGHTMGMNYAFDKIRFLAPVPRRVEKSAAASQSPA